jgi:hypothetical protein
MNWLELAKGRHSIAPDFPDVAFLHSLGRNSPLLVCREADVLLRRPAGFHSSAISVASESALCFRT